MLYKTLNNKTVSVDKSTKICYTISEYDRENNNYNHLCFVKHDNISNFINIFGLTEVK